MPTKPSSLVVPTVHLVGPGKIKILNGQLAFSTGKGTPQRLDLNALRTIVCHGPVGVTDDAMILLFNRGIELSWLSQRDGRCRGRVVPSRNDRTTLRSIQHRVFSDPDFRLAFARDVVGRKIGSQIDAARHYQKQGRSIATLHLAALRQASDDAPRAERLASLRGVEGAASAAWFNILAAILLPPFRFPGRRRRPPTDPVNALLSLGYTWLCQRVAGRIEAAGLELNLGALHDYRPGRPSLACDLMEPLRIPFVDRWAIRLFNRQELAPADFTAPAADDPRELVPEFDSPGDTPGLQSKPHAARRKRLPVHLVRGKFAPVLASWEQHASDHNLSTRLDLAIDELTLRMRQDRVPGTADSEAESASRSNASV